MLLPDVVLMYRPEIEPYKERKGALMVLRSDAEGRLSRENRQSIYKLLMEKISTINAPAAIGTYSQGMIVGN